MPIVVKDFEWTQSSTTVTIKVPLKGVPTKKVSIYGDSLYVKAHYAPYFFEMDLLHAVDYEKSRVLLGEQGCIVFILQKQEADLTWTDLQYVESEADGEDVRSRRLRAQEEYQRRHADEVDRMLNKTVAKPEGVDWVQKQIDAQRAARDSVKQQKAEAFQTAAQDLEQWQSTTKENTAKNNEIVKSVSAAVAKVPASVPKEEPEVQRPPVREFKRVNCEFTVCKPDHFTENCLIVDSMPMRTRDKGPRPAQPS